MKRIFVINGSGGQGKDSFIEFVGEYVKVQNYSSIDLIKELARHFGWNGGKSEKDRKFLSDLKALSLGYNEMVHEHDMSAVNDWVADNTCDILFVHIREIDEIEKFVKAVRFKYSAVEVKTVLVHNSNVEDITSNDSDGRVWDMTYDMYIDNSGSLDDLKESAKFFLQEMGIVD